MCREREWKKKKRWEEKGKKERRKKKGGGGVDLGSTDQQKKTPKKNKNKRSSEREDGPLFCFAIRSKSHQETLSGFSSTIHPFLFPLTQPSPHLSLGTPCLALAQPPPPRPRFVRLVYDKCRFSFYIVLEFLRLILSFWVLLFCWFALAITKPPSIFPFKLTVSSHHSIFRRTSGRTNGRDGRDEPLRPLLIVQTLLALGNPKKGREKKKKVKMVQFSNPLKFGTDLWDPSHRYETSWLLSPYVLCAFRATFVRPSYLSPRLNFSFPLFLVFVPTVGPMFSPYVIAYLLRL